MTELHELVKRIRKERRLLELDQKEMSSFLGIGISSYQKLEAGTIKLSKANETIISNYFDKKEKTSFFDPINSKFIPFFNVDLTTINKILFEDFEFPPSNYYSIPNVEGNFAAPIYTKALTPDVNVGDVIIWRECLEKKIIHYGMIHLIATIDGEIIIKKVRKSTKEGHISLLTNNEEFDDFEFPNSFIRAIYVAVQVIPPKLIN